MKRMRMPKRIRTDAGLLILGSAGQVVTALRASSTSAPSHAFQHIASRKGHSNV